jgi:hypothetical protein
MTYYATHEIYKIANEAYLRIVEGEDPKKFHQDTIVVLIFSVITLESFISELLNFASKFHKMHPRIEVFAEFFKELDSRESSGSLKTKYYMAKWLLTGTTFKRGEAPFQDFSMLVDIRNAITHLKPDELGGKKIETLLSRLKEKGLIDEYEHELPIIVAGGVEKRKARGLWLRNLYDLRVAKWACNTVPNIIQGIIEDAPDEEVRRFYDGSNTKLYKVIP